VKRNPDAPCARKGPGPRGDENPKVEFLRAHIRGRESNLLWENRDLRAFSRPSRNFWNHPQKKGLTISPGELIGEGPEFPSPQRDQAQDFRTVFGPNCTGPFQVLHFAEGQASSKVIDQERPFIGLDLYCMFNVKA